MKTSYRIGLLLGLAALTSAGPHGVAFSQEAAPTATTQTEGAAQPAAAPVAPAPAAAPTAAAPTAAPTAAPAPAAPDAAAPGAAVAPAPDAAPAGGAMSFSRSGTGSRWHANPEEVTRRLSFVSTLVEKSTGAQRIDTQGNAEAKAKRDEAKNFLLQADQAHQQGDDARAMGLLDQASKTMFEGIRMADGGAAKKEKGEQDFKNRMESVKVLLEAQERISKEKNAPDAAATKTQIASHMAEAEKLAAAGQLDKGRQELDKAYVVAKLSIEKMRQGDTLVRSLNFASKEEEYHYEVDRNDTHHMLVNMLLQGKEDSIVKMAQGFVEKGDALRKEAEAAAGQKNFDEAVKIMEQATQELIRAIRSAGIYIPG